MRDRAASSQWSFALLLFAAAFVLFQYGLPQLLPHPIHPDDYNNAGGGFADISWHWKRLVSSNLIFMAAEPGLVTAYGALAALAVVDAVLVLMLVARIFGQRLGMAALLVFAVLVSSHVSAFLHGTYLGLLTNLISHFFGLLALWGLLRGWDGARAGWLCMVLVAYLFSAFSKEDFLLPPLLLCAYLWFQSRSKHGHAIAGTPTWHWLLPVALLAIAAGSMGWHAHARNPFVAGLFSPETSASTYAVDLTVGGLARATWKLLGGYVPLVSALALAASAWLWWRRPEHRTTVAWFVFTVAALVLPYALIPLNMPVFRAYAWLPWLAAITVVAMQSALDALPSGRRRRAVVSLLAWAGLAVLAVVVHAPAHRERADAYAGKSALNRRMIDAVLEHRELVSASSRVGLVGLGASSPWCAQDAHYLRKLGFDTHWVVFTPSPTVCYTQQVPDAARKIGIYVSVRPLSELCGHGALPVLHFGEDGSAVLETADTSCR